MSCRNAQNAVVDVQSTRRSRVRTSVRGIPRKGVLCNTTI
jgi:hypothetical protein